MPARGSADMIKLEWWIWLVLALVAVGIVYAIVA